METSESKYPVVLAHVYSMDNCRKNKHILFVFGDNEKRVGKGGQAKIREEKNAIGIATKFSPESCWNDRNLLFNKQSIDSDIERVKDYYDEWCFKAVCFPKNGIGTGLANMQVECPRTFLYLCERLLDEFGFNNMMGLKTEY